MAVVMILLTLVLFAAESNELTVDKVAVEGLSRNVDILCNLDRQFHPLYWKIQGQIYDLYSIPELFIIREHEAITIPTVDRRMDGWDFQCFTVDPRRENRLHPGQITNLTVLYNRDVAGPDENVELLRSSTKGRVVLHYRDLQVGPDITTVSWLYSPNSLRPCTASGFGIDLYPDTIINTESLENQQPVLNYFEASKRMQSLRSQFLDANYCQISALQGCGRSPYFYKLSISDAIRRDIYVNGTSASFEIPENLRNNQSLQWVWSKDDNNQCVCPPVEQFMSQCACNIENPNSNLVSISNNQIVITNLRQENGEGEVILHLVSSVSSGCLGTCNLKSTVAEYRIIATQGYPAPPNLRVNGIDEFCFTIPDNSISPEVYEVNLTDSTGSLTRLSGVYNTSHCLTITSDLHPNVCGPFLLSVAAMNAVGREVTQQVINGTAVPCDCYQEKGMVHLLSTVTSTSANLALSCEYNEDIMLAVSAAETAIMVTTSCNSTKLVDSLNSSTDYNVSIVLRGSMTSCYLHHFQTSRPADALQVVAVLAGVTSVVILTVVAMTIIICSCLLICVRRRVRVAA